MRREYMVLFLLNLAEYFASAENRRSAVASDQDEPDWWETAVFYQIYPRSFMDSDGDGVGDLKGIEEKAEHFKDMGVDCVWLSPIYKSPMADFGYDISDYRQVDSTFGTVDDFVSLQKKLESLDIKLIMDFVPNHSSDEHEWFKKSVQKIDPYTEYYVWKDAKIDQNGSRVPPNNWQSLFSNSAWTWNEERGQYYLHQFDPKQPDLNYRKKELVEEMKNNLRFWLDRGVNGFRVDAVPFLFEDLLFKDDLKKPDELALKEKNTYDQYYHDNTMDLPETYDMIHQFREVLDEYKAKDGKTRVMITEAYTSLENTIKYYGNETSPGAHVPFNFGLISYLNDQSNAADFNDIILKWMNSMSDGKKANWVIGNHDVPRVATRLGSETADAMNMLVLLMPGTSFTYMGEEIGMEDTNVRWDQTIDPRGKNAGPDGYRVLSRDPCRTPYQWNASVSAGFSANSTTWLPVNPNYWTLNLESQMDDQSRSHYNVYKRLTELKKTKTISRGSFKPYVVDYWIYMFCREWQESEVIAMIFNCGSQDELVNISENQCIRGKQWYVHTSSINSEHNIGDMLNTSGFMMRPKSALVLSDHKTDTKSKYKMAQMVTTRSSSPSLIYPSAMSLVAFGFILANRYGILGF